MSALRVVACGGLVVMLQLSCGGDDPPVCPTGNCNLPGSTIVKWKFNNYPELGFDSDACSDLAAVQVRVEVTNVADAAIYDVMEKGCGEGQLTFLGLTPGTYDVAITPLDIDGTSLVTAPVVMQGPAGTQGANSEIVVNVPYDAWLRSYTGQFLYRLAWGGVSCAVATPAVVTQRLTLTAGGQVVTATNDRGDKLDGTQDVACWALTEQFPQNVAALPFGPATLLVIGKDAASMTVFEKQFDTFIGAGNFNPTLTFDVTPDAGVDASVDAPIDAMLLD